jgi:hypothetical protein
VAITYKKTVASFVDTVGVEEAEELLAWLKAHPRCKVNLAECKHLHAAHLQVLMATRTPISAWPRDAPLKAWLESALG